MTLVLHETPGAWGAPSISPFCIKLECYLRMAGIEYEARVADFRRAPKGKIPFVEIDGRLVGDSQLIIELLKQKHGDPLDARLDARRRAIGHATRRMLEEATYFVGLWTRWGNDAGWEQTRSVFRRILPKPFGFLASVIRREQKKKLHAQGTGRHSPQEIQAMGKADLTALSTLLGDGPYLLGAEPTSFDATAYAFVEALLCFPVQTDVKQHAAGLANLVEYRERMRARYFADGGKLGGG
jgi:glutathione S-transferase